MKLVKDKQLVVGADFAGFPLKEAVVAHLQKKGWQILDLGVKKDSDPNDTDPWEDQRIMRTLRLCDTYNVPCATNLATAEMLILGLQRGDLDWRMMMKNKKTIR